jgi:hypothetical protein
MPIEIFLSAANDWSEVLCNVCLQRRDASGLYWAAKHSIRGHREMGHGLMSLLPPFLLPSGLCHKYSILLLHALAVYEYCACYSRAIVLSLGSRATNARSPLAARRMNPEASKVESRTTSAGRDLAVSIGSEPNPGDGHAGRLQVPCCWMQAQNPAPDSASTGRTATMRTASSVQGGRTICSRARTENVTPTKLDPSFTSPGIVTSALPPPRSSIPGTRRRQK